MSSLLIAEYASEAKSFELAEIDHADNLTYERSPVGVDVTDKRCLPIAIRLRK